MIRMYIFPIKCPKDLFADITATPDVNLLPKKLISRVTKPGVCVVTQLYIDGVAQLAMDLDLYEVSATLNKEIRDAFLKEHNLVDKTYDEIDEYLDYNELSIPDNCRLELPTIGPNRRVRITGAFEEECNISFIGLAL